MQRWKIGKISIFNSLDIIFNYLMSWVENLNWSLTQSQYQVESEDSILYSSWVRRFNSSNWVKSECRYENLTQRSV